MFVHGWQQIVNLPLPSASTSAAPGATRYAPSDASASNAADLGGGGTPFASHLANAAQSAGSQALRHPASTGFPRSSTDSQPPAAQASDRTGAKQAGSERRPRLKTGKPDSAGAGIQRDGDASPFSCSAAGPPSLPAPPTDALSAAGFDESLSPAETLISGSRFSQSSSDSDPGHAASDCSPVAQAGDRPDDASAPPEAVGDANGPTETAIEGFTGSGKTVPSGAKSAPAASTTAPAAQVPPAGSRDSDDSAGSMRQPADSRADATSIPPAGLPSVTGEPSSNPVEKIAPSWTPATKDQMSRVVRTANDAASFTRLTSVSQQVATTSDSVGIASAELGTGMCKPAATPTPARSDRRSGTDILQSVSESLTFDGARTSAPVANIVSEHASTPVSHSAAAVEATLDAVEHMRDAAHSSVELKLSFSDDARLAVRIELRNDVVHTTFRTDSNELRQALSSEWRLQAPAFAAASSEHPVRIADPVFATASGSMQSTGTSTGGHADSRKTPEPAPAESFLASPRRQQPQAASATSLPSGQLRLPTSLRLNVFA